MIEFLNKHNGATPKKFDDICKDFMSDKIPEDNLKISTDHCHTA